jgi:hypothetical protein
MLEVGFLGMSGSPRSELKLSWISAVGWALAGSLGCTGAAEPATPACSGQRVAGCQATPAHGGALGLRVSLSDEAKSVCVFDEGCGGAPKGAIRIQPLQANIREALSEALVAAGFELVERDAERDVVADVEWRGTDTIALRLQDGHGRMIDQASFRRSLERCHELPELTWDTCWAANFPRMKEELTRPLRRSVALQAFARQARGGGADTALVELSPTRATKEGIKREARGEHLDALQLQETVARYREGLQRRCWLPALEARDPSAPSAARVHTTVTIGPNGIVEQVSASADPRGYPRLSSCIVGQVRQWRFPPARSSSVATIPFVFAGD